MASDYSLDSIFIQTPANLLYETGGISPVFTDVDSTEQFIIQIINNGQSRIDLDSNLTTVNFSDFTAQLSANSDQSINGNDTTELVFRPTTIPGTVLVGSYPVELNLVGLSNTSYYSEILISNQIVTVGGNVSITGISVTPVFVQPEETGLLVTMNIANRGTAVPIEVAGTTLEFYDELSQLQLVNNLTRTDTLDTLQTIENNRLTFTFDVPEDFSGRYGITGYIKTEGSEQKAQDFDNRFTVFTGSNTIYLSNSLSPSSVVPGEEETFSISIIDSGAAGLTLIPDSSYLEIDFTPFSPQRTYLGGNFAIQGNDTTTIYFNNLTIPDTILTGDYEINVHLVGTPSFNQVDTVSQDILSCHLKSM